MKSILAGSPLLTLGLGAALLLLLLALRRDGLLLRRGALAVLALATLTALAAIIPLSSPAALTPLLQADQLAAGATLLFSLAGGACLVMPDHTALDGEDQPEEYHLLMVIAILGACVLAYADHLGSLLLGLEITAVALYGLISYSQKERHPLEAAIKYLIVSSAASATLLLGFAFIYAATGRLDFAAIGMQLSAGVEATGVASFGTLLVLGGLAVKMAIVPFHLWTADVYEGAPTPITALLASVAKAAALLAFVRLVVEAKLVALPGIGDAIALLAFLTILAGNWLALLQDNLKRLLAFSSIAHAGYMLVPLACMHEPALAPMAQDAVLFYLTGYLVATVAAFAVVARLREPGSRGDLRPSVTALTGLFWRSPAAAAVLMLALLSLAGVPLTAGFMGKLYLFSNAVGAGRGALLVALIVGSAVGVYYYLRLIFTMSREAGEHGPELSLPASPGNLTLLAAALFIASLGLAPAPFLEFLRGALAHL